MLTKRKTLFLAFAILLVSSSLINLVSADFAFIGTEDGRVLLWSLEAASLPPAVLRTHKGPVSHVKLLNGDKLVTFGSEDKKLVVSDLINRGKSAPLELRSRCVLDLASVSSIELNKSGSMILGFYDGSLHFINLTTCQQTLESPYYIDNFVWSLKTLPNRSSNGVDYLVVGTYGGKLRYFNTQSNKFELEEIRVDSSSESIMSIEASENIIFAGTEAGNVTMWRNSFAESFAFIKPLIPTSGWSKSVHLVKLLKPKANKLRVAGASGNSLCVFLVDPSAPFEHTLLNCHGEDALSQVVSFNSLRGRDNDTVLVSYANGHVKRFNLVSGDLLSDIQAVSNTSLTSFCYVESEQLDEQMSVDITTTAATTTHFVKSTTSGHLEDWSLEDAIELQTKLFAGLLASIIFLLIILIFIKLCSCRITFGN